MAGNLKPSVQPRTAQQDMVPSVVLTAAARQNMLQSGPKTSTTPRYMEKPHSDQVPFVRPITGKLGTVCPGSQYWSPYHDIAPSDSEAFLSTTAASFEKRPEANAELVPLTARTHGRGTGYCGNTVSISGVDWMRQEPNNHAQTTYDEMINTGFYQFRVGKTFPRSASMAGGA
mmetsp:Transcript_97955/g.277075  ORF Transcript_97955/g.277075 Transcript_97955/m.277075 type:complete len:173 (-) Transcript_97955:112-630(-)